MGYLRPAIESVSMSAFLHPFLISTGVVATAEVGDKTQLLSLVLAARFRRPWPILAGILLATVANHGVAAWLGEWVGSLLTAGVLRWVLGVSFIVAAVWVLVPDKLDDEEGGVATSRWGPFVTTLVGFFLAEMGDKTQVATIALGARFETLLPVVAGTTLGMMLANTPAVVLGHSAADRIPIAPIRIIAAIIFLALGVTQLV